MAPRLIIHDIAFSERPVRFQHPFRFGVVTVNGAPQVFVQVEIEVEGHGRSRGATAELMVPKWFNKDPALTPDQTIDQLRQSLEIARRLYLSCGEPDTAFGLHAACYDRQVAACAEAGIPALAGGYGPAEIDKAVLDALLRALELDVFAGLKRNVAGLDARLAPDVADSDVQTLLGSRSPNTRIAIRHTVGLNDDVAGLPHIIARTGCRFFKIKVGGNPDQDRARLTDIGRTLEQNGCDYYTTLDANEAYADFAALTTLVDILQKDRALENFFARLHYIEQPMPRELTWNQPLGALAEVVPFLIDEADDGYDAFPRARALGYRGVSSKACKGIYKALLNATRCFRWNLDGANVYFVSAEDLTCQAGLAVQQDTAIAAFLGCYDVERNGHHYVDGFDGAPDSEARAFLAAHPDLYEEVDGRVRLAVRKGNLEFGSLVAPGFASSVLPPIDRPGSTTSLQSREYVT